MYSSICSLVSSQGEVQLINGYGNGRNTYWGLTDGLKEILIKEKRSFS